MKALDKSHITIMFICIAIHICALMCRLSAMEMRPSYVGYPQYAANGSFISFVVDPSQGEEGPVWAVTIYSVAERTTEIIVRAGWSVVHPKNSPDNNKMAFWARPVNYAGGRLVSLQVMEIESRDLKTIGVFDIPDKVHPAKWAQGGRQLAFVTPALASGKGNVNVYDLDQGVLHQVSRVGVYRSLSVSIYDKYLLFVDQEPGRWNTCPPFSRRMAELGDNKIMIMSVGQFSSRVLYEENSNEYLDIRNPTWSPDGKMILYVKETSESEAIWLMDRDGKNHRLLANDAHYPTWSGDTRRVACIYRDSLSVIDVQSGRIAPIFDLRDLRPKGPFLTEGPPAWSPDGKQIAFYCSTENGDGLWLVNADGGNLKEVYHSPPTFVKDASKEKESEKESQLARSYWYLGGSIMLLILILIVMIVLVRIKG